MARAYDAICTPDFFGFNRDLELQYRGRLDASRREAVPDAPRELVDAMLQVARTGAGPQRPGGQHGLHDLEAGRLIGHGRQARVGQTARRISCS